MKQPRILLTSRYPAASAGGVEAVVGALLPRLQSRESWRVRAVSAFRRRRGLARVPLLGDIAASIRLAAVVLRRGDDVMVINGFEYALAPLMVARLRGVRVLVVWHGLRSVEVRALRPGGWLRQRAIARFAAAQSLLERVALKAAAHIAVSPTVAGQIAAKYGGGAVVTVAANGVAVPDSASPRAPDWPAALWVGGTTYNKGLDVAVAAVAEARARIESLQLVVAGIPDPPPWLWGGQQPPDWIDWRGPMAPVDLARLYDEVEVLLFPSRYEGCPMVVLEALAHGLPVVGPEPVVGWMIGSAGVTVDGWDPHSYRDALCRVFAAGPGAFRESATDRAREFSWDTSAQIYAGVIESLLRPASVAQR